MSEKKRTCRNCKYRIFCERRWDKRIAHSLKELVHDIRKVFPECDLRVEFWLQDTLDEIIGRNCRDYEEDEPIVIQHTFFKPEL